MSTRTAPLPLALAGVGMVLPGPDGSACTSLETFNRVVNDGRCCLSAFEHPGLALRLAGQVHDWDPNTALRIDERAVRRSSRAAHLATGAVQNALDHAGLDARDIDPDRTVLVTASLQFASPEMERYHAVIADRGPAALAMDYWMSGTPASVVGTVASGLGIECPTLSIAGSCNVALRTLHVVRQMFTCGEIDRAIVVGVDTTVDPVFVAGTVHEGRRGYRASSLSDVPADVRPHDQSQTGNATGEGAVAVVLERPSVRTTGDRPLVSMGFRTSRSNGVSAVATGPPDNVARDIAGVLADAGARLADVAFVNDYADGNRFVEDHLCEALRGARKVLDYDGELLLTNQEAAFGHVAGIGGLIKLVASTLMLADQHAGPSINCQTVYESLPATPVPRAGRSLGGDRALVVTSGAGGDSTTMLLQLHGGSLR
jgi:minimal PKS ketosynthase (KS/KS alpha)